MEKDKLKIEKAIGEVDNNIIATDDKLSNVIWTRPLTNGQPLFSPYYVGDCVNPDRSCFFRFVIAIAVWEKSEVGFGQASDGITGWNWDEAAPYQTVGRLNIIVRSDISNIQFFHPGNWYVCGRVRESADSPFSYTVRDKWSNNQVFSTANCSSFIVQALNNPTAQSASAFGTTITLNWIPEALSQNHNVLVVRYISESEIRTPENGSVYTAGDRIGSGIVVYNGMPATGITDNNLDYDTDYTYYFYSQNNNCYSSGVFATTRTEPTSAIGVTPPNGVFTSAVGTESGVQAFVISVNNLSIEITATAPANYLLSLDGIVWGDTASIDSIGGALYVKYIPTTVETNQTAIITLSSAGTSDREIPVTGSTYAPTEVVVSAQTFTGDDDNVTPKDNRFWAMLKHFSSYATILLVFILLLRIYELFINQMDRNIKSYLVGFISTALMSDLLFFCMVAGYLFAFTRIISIVSRKASHVLLTVLSAIIAIGHLMLIKYFSVALNPLGGDVFQYSMAEIKQTVGATANSTLILTLCSVVVVFMLAFVFLPRFIKVNKAVGVTFLVLSLLGVMSSFNEISLSPKFGSEYNNNLVLNKSTYFYKAVWQYYFPQPERDIFDEMSEMFADNLVGTSHESGCVNDFTFKDDANYPFLHADSTKDVLSPFFNSGNKAPNIVFVVVEGLGRAFSNENAYLGSFTPFIDSLSQHSLYWENCLSSAGRTFEVFPSVLGSLPYGQHGFAELGEQMPSHLSLISILADNGYNSSFFYGGDSKFDNMKLFMEWQNVNHIYDETTYDHSYQKLPVNSQGFTWGYGDSELFRRYLAELDKQPDNLLQVNALLTVSTHSPFKLNDQNKYDALFEKRMRDLKFDAITMNQHREYKPQYASILYMDDAMRHFFKSYALRPSFKNTIFIITGDHRMPDIPMSTKIDRYHVPLVIYSPMLRRTAQFSAVVSHLDITPSLLAYVKSQYHIKTPSLVTWIGAGLDTVRYFRNNSNYPLMPTKQGVSEYLSGNYMISGNDVFQLLANMGFDPVGIDDKERTKIMLLLNKFIQRNDKMITKRKMLPDSILTKYSVK